MYKISKNRGIMCFKVWKALFYIGKKNVFLNINSSKKTQMNYKTHGTSSHRCVIYSKMYAILKTKSKELQFATSST